MTWTAPAFDRCLLLSLVYPIATIFIIWAAPAHVGLAENALGLSDVASWRRGLVPALSVTFPLVACGRLSARLPDGRRLTVTIGRQVDLRHRLNTSGPPTRPSGYQIGAARRHRLNAVPGVPTFGPSAVVVGEPSVRRRHPEGPRRQHRAA